MNNKLNITWCYPDILNLYGDYGNLIALEKVGKLLDLDVNITRVNNLTDSIDFDNTDILIFNPGQLKTLEAVINALNEQKKELKKYIDNNKIIIAVGSSGAIFSNRIIRIDKGDLLGLGFLDMNCYEKVDTKVDNLLVKIKDSNMKLIGNQVSVMDTILNSEIEFSKVKYGIGNNEEKEYDGARYKNLIFTNMLGPLFIKNPWFAEEIIRQAMKNKKVEIEKIINDEEYEYELKSFSETEKYLFEK